MPEAVSGYAPTGMSNATGCRIRTLRNIYETIRLDTNIFTQGMINLTRETAKFWQIFEMKINRDEQRHDRAFIRHLPGTTADDWNQQLY